MNDLTLLNQYGPDAPAVHPDVVARARARLLTEIDAEEPAGRAHRRGRAGLLTAAAAIVVGAVTVQLLTASGHTGASAEAATLLTHAATATIGLPVAAPGQYYYERSALTSVTAVPCPAACGGSIKLAYTQQYETWIPADRRGVGRQRSSPRPPTYATPADETAALRSCPNVLREYAQLYRPTDRTARVAALAPAGSGPFQRYDRATLARWPRNPRQLLALMTRGPSERGRSAQALINATDLLGAGPVLPADLRVAIFKTIALIPGIKVLPTKPGATAAIRSFTVTDNQHRRITADVNINSGYLVGIQETDKGALDFRDTTHFGIATTTGLPPTHLT